jgi:hypothetical protein
MVAAVLKVAMGVFDSERRDRRPNGFEQRLSAAGLGFAQEVLYLAEGFLNRIEVR